MHPSQLKTAEANPDCWTSDTYTVRGLQTGTEVGKGKYPLYPTQQRAPRVMCARISGRALVKSIVIHFPHFIQERAGM